VDDRDRLSAYDRPMIRPRFRYRLTTLCFFILLTCMACAYVARLRFAAQRHFAAEDRITSAGGMVYYGYEFEGTGDWDPQTVPPVPRWLAAIIGVRAYGGTRVVFDFAGYSPDSRN